MIAAAVIVVYLWNLAAHYLDLLSGPVVPDVALAVAGGALIVNIVLFLRESEHTFIASLISFYLALALLTTLGVMELGHFSAFALVCWALIAAFASAFAWYGAAPVLFIGASYLAWTAYDSSFTAAVLGILVVSTLLPVVIGWLVLQRARGEHEPDDIYHELRSKLSSVSGQSDAILTAISNGIIAVDARGTITLINPAATKILGWRHEDAIGLDYHTVLKFNDARDQALPDDQHPIQLAHVSGKEIKSESLLLITNDAEKRIQASITATPLSDGRVIAAFRDVTEERLEEREQAEFISTASHEMRTPVASIEGFLGLALNPATAQIDDKARSFILKAHESAQHLGRLFQDLLDVSKADDSRMQNNPQIIDLVPFMHDIITGLLPKAEAKSLFIDFKPNPDFHTEPTDIRQSYGSNLDHDTARTLTPVFYVNVDNDHLREVADNLVENAIKYTPKGSITIDVTGDDDHVLLSIADSGIGIPTEDIPHLFQKFYRVDNSDTREIGGTGLGLYLCRKLTEAMGGKIWVESTYKEGSVFYVQLPRVSSVDAQRIIEESTGNATTTGISDVTTSAADSDSIVSARESLTASLSEYTAPTPSATPAPVPVPTTAPTLTAVAPANTTPNPPAAAPAPVIPSPTVTVTPAPIPQPLPVATIPAPTVTAPMPTPPPVAPVITVPVPVVTPQPTIPAPLPTPAPSTSNLTPPSVQ